jgi:hypothetical protein
MKLPWDCRVFKSPGYEARSPFVVSWSNHERAVGGCFDRLSTNGYPGHV